MSRASVVGYPTGEPLLSELENSRSRWNDLQNNDPSTDNH